MGSIVCLFRPVAVPPFTQQFPYKYIQTITLFFDMATENFYYTENKTVRVTKLCIQEGHVFVAGQVLFHYDLINDNGAREETAIPPNKQSSHSHVVRANNSSGLVESIKIKEGDEISNG